MDALALLAILAVVVAAAAFLALLIVSAVGMAIARRAAPDRAVVRTPEEWEAAAAQGALYDMNVRDYVGALIVGGRVIPISLALSRLMSTRLVPREDVEDGFADAADPRVVVR